MHELLSRLETLKQILIDAQNSRFFIMRQFETHMAQVEREMLEYEDKIKRMIQELEAEANETEKNMEAESKTPIDFGQKALKDSLGHVS